MAQPVETATILNAQPFLMRVLTAGGTDGRTDGQTDAPKRIISPASWSIIKFTHDRYQTCSRCSREVIHLVVSTQRSVCLFASGHSSVGTVDLWPWFFSWGSTLQGSKLLGFGMSGTPKNGDGNQECHFFIPSALKSAHRSIRHPGNQLTMA